MAQRRKAQDPVSLADGLKAGAEKVEDRYNEQIRATSAAKEFSKALLFIGDVELDLNLRPSVGSRISVLGEQHMGKTATAYRLMAAQQRLCRQCMTPILPFVNFTTGETATTCRCGQKDPCRVVYFDMQTEFDPGWAKTLGLDIGAETTDGFVETVPGLLVGPDARFAICRASTAEQVSTVAETLIEMGAADMIVIDSIASLVPNEQKQGKAQPAARARAVSTMVGKLMSAQGAALIREGIAPTVVFTNEFRTNIQMMNPKADNREAAGGKAAKYFTMQEWRLYSSYNEGLTDRTIEHKYADMRFTLTKDKLGGMTNRQANMRLFLKNTEKNRLTYMAGETDNPERLLEIMKDISDKTGDLRWFEKKSGYVNVLGRRFKTAQGIKEYLRQPGIAYRLLLPIFVQLLPPSTLHHLDVDNFLYGPFDQNDVLSQLIYETKERIGLAALRNVGRRSWMAQPNTERGDEQPHTNDPEAAEGAEDQEDEG